MPEDAKVYVGNLSFDCQERELREHFEKYGHVEDVNIILDRDRYDDRRSRGPPRSKGYGFVTFESIEDAEDAIDGLNETTFLGRKINVEKSRGKPDYSRDRRDDDRRGGRDRGRRRDDRDSDYGRDRDSGRDRRSRSPDRYRSRR